MKKNIIANLIGKFWSILSNFAFIPLYIKYLGFENYSLISFGLMITGIMTILDSGLTATLSREFARQDTTDKEKFRVYTNLETIYFIIVFTIITLLYLFSGAIAENWINTQKYTPHEVSFFIKILSFEIGFQFLFRFYLGGLLGLKKQVEANVYQVLWGILRNGLVILPIMYYSSLSVFFIWQTVSTLLFTILIKLALNRSIGSKNIFFTKLKIEKEVFNTIKNFAGGMMLITLVSVINTQLDKITISKLLSIENLGYYTLVISISQGLIVLISPISTALLPVLTGHYTNNNKEGAKQLFKKANLIISIVLFSILANMIFYSKDLIWIWTGDKNLANHTADLVPIVASAYAMISLQLLPYNVSISNGYTKLNNILGFISLLITIPGYIYIVRFYGVIGAALVFAVVQIITTLIYYYFINDRFLKLKFVSEIFVKQLILPCVIAIGVGFVLHHFYFLEQSRLFSFLWIGFATMVTLIISGLLLLSKNDLKKIIILRKK